MAKYIYIACGVVIAALFGALRYQSGVIDDLEVVKARQAETITLQADKITKLESDIAENQRVTLELSKAETETREEQNAVIKSIPKADKQSSAFNSAAPSALIDFLRK